MGTSESGVDEGVGGAYKRGPFWVALGWRALRGMLFEIVEKWEGMRGRRPWVAKLRAQCERLEAFLGLPVGGSGMNLRV